MIKKKTAIIYAIIAVFFLADRLLKQAFLGVWRDRAFDLWENFLELRFGANYLMAFSWPVSVGIVSAVSALILAAVIYLAFSARRRHSMNEYYCLLAIISGAVSNLLDRLSFGFVVDYISFADISVLNLADIMISLGIVGLVIVYARNNKTN